MDRLSRERPSGGWKAGSEDVGRGPIPTVFPPRRPQRLDPGGLFAYDYMGVVWELLEHKDSPDRDLIHPPFTHGGEGSTASSTVCGKSSLADWRADPNWPVGLKLGRDTGQATSGCIYNGCGPSWLGRLRLRLTTTGFIQVSRTGVGPTNVTLSVQR